jgi:hypothetical protein
MRPDQHSSRFVLPHSLPRLHHRQSAEDYNNSQLPSTNDNDYQCKVLYPATALWGEQQAQNMINLNDNDSFY